MSAHGSVWLLCWSHWDYDHHEDPVAAYSTKTEALAAAKAKPEGTYDANERKRARPREGWSVMEVEMGAPFPLAPESALRAETDGLRALDAVRKAIE